MSYKKYWLKFIDSQIKYDIWWDCTFKVGFYFGLN